MCLFEYTVSMYSMYTCIHSMYLFEYTARCIRCIQYIFDVFTISMGFGSAGPTP